MPIFRGRPPLTEQEIEDALAFTSSRNAFWRNDREPRPVDEALAGATFGQIVGYCVLYSHNDICNGGFHQYFWNQGDLAAVTADALVGIGQVERAELMKKAMARFPGGVAPRSRAACQRLLDQIDFHGDWRPWVRPIEDAYYALGEQSLSDAVRAYVVAHPHEYFLDH